MKKSLIALALVGAFAAPAFAEEAAAPAEHTLTGNIGLVSNYVFRGISQSQNKPALQGGFDYAHSSGLYAGTWLSNVAWVEDTAMKTGSSLEWDLYAGYKGSFADDFTYDVGGLYYYYPGKVAPGFKNTNSAEIYGAIGWKFITLKYSHTVSENLFGWYNSGTSKSTRGSGYWDLTANYDLGEGWGVNAHVGHQKIKNLGDASYTDWKVGVTKDVGFGVVGLAYSDTNAKTCGDSVASYCWGPAGAQKNVSKGFAILSFNKTF